MNLDHSHLAPATAELLTASDNDRISIIREDRWVTYPRARSSLEVLEALLARPRTTRMPSVAIYADSGMGKTMLVERFKRAHPAVYNPAERRLVSPVLALQMASHATERRFYGQLLTAIGVPFVSRATILDLETQALRSLKRMDVKLLMLDEVHNILAVRSGRPVTATEPQLRHRIPVPRSAQKTRTLPATAADCQYLHHWREC